MIEKKKRTGRMKRKHTGKFTQDVIKEKELREIRFEVMFDSKSARMLQDTKPKRGNPVPITVYIENTPMGKQAKTFWLPKTSFRSIQNLRIKINFGFGYLTMDNEYGRQANFINHVH